MSTNEKAPKILIGGIVEKQELNKLYKKIENNKNHFDDYIVAYLDFLGFAEKMKEENSYESLQILKFLLNGIEKVAAQISKINETGLFESKIFSDNIILALKIEQKNIDIQIMSLINLISSIQLNALLYFGFLIRGGVTIGKLSIDSSIVWGTGLIDAYNIEDNLAIYPRIILSPKIIETYKSCEQKRLNLYAFIKIDFDGLWFIDFLLAAPNLTLIPTIAEILNDITKLYINKSERVKQKINWVISHFNIYCNNFKERGDYEKYILPYI